MGVSHPQIRLTADPALLLEPAEAARVDGFLLSKGMDPNGKYALFVLRPWEGLDVAAPAFAAAAEYAWEKHGLTPVFLALEPKRDLPVSQQTAAMVSCPCHVISAPHAGDLIVGLMGRMQVVVSMRLHALIFAAGQGIPLVGVVYDPKVSGFLDYLDQKRYLDMKDVTLDALTAGIDDALSVGTDSYSVSRLRKLAEENDLAARELLEGGSGR